MKTSLYTTEDIVHKALILYEDARGDDFLLIYRVFQLINENAVIREPFYHVMLNHNEYKLPAIASIMRARRKIYEKHPSLKPKKATKIRKRKEKEYKSYSRS